MSFPVDISSRIQGIQLLIVATLDLALLFYTLLCRVWCNDISLSPLVVYWHLCWGIFFHYLAFLCIYSPCFHTYAQIFENKLILCPPKPSTWLTFTAHPVLERCQYPIWLPSIILVICNLLSQSNRRTKEIVTN